MQLTLTEKHLESEVMQAGRADSAYLEGSKLDSDTFKTQATLSIASIAGVAAVSSLFRPVPDYLPLLVLSILLLLICMAVSLSSMRLVAAGVYTILGSRDPDRIEEFMDTETQALSARGARSVWALGSGLVAFSLFALLNLAYPEGDFLQVVLNVLQS